MAPTIFKKQVLQRRKIYENYRMVCHQIGDRSMRINLSAQQPFSFSSVVGSHGWQRLAPFERDSHGDSLTYVDRLTSGRVVALMMKEAPEGVDLQVNETLEPEENDEIIQKVTWMLGLKQDFTEFYNLARTEPRLAHVEKRAQGRILRCPTLFEDLVKTILTTNTTWSGTIRMVAGLVDQFGDPLPEEPQRRAFPTPEQIAVADEARLRNETRLGYRAPYILEIAQAVAGGSLDLEVFKSEEIPTEQLHKRLLGIKGVGRYAAANLMMILGHYDHLPVDSWALKMVSQEWYDGDPIGEAQVHEAFQGWGKWKGLAYWFWDWSTEQ
jgi:3-methyladenine DNA glycosylase/8-oxoguanine DNA glycosylase